MKLLTLTLRNFMGIREFTLDCLGKKCSIFGDNGTGKTTIASAWHWLLFNKDSLGRSDFEIKTLENGEPVHGLEHEVEAVIQTDKALTLRKVYREKWTKQRGSAQAEFTGHTTQHYLDGVPVPKKDYDAKIASIVDEGIFRLLTNPRAFNDLHWERRRSILLQVCGNVTMEDVIASNPKLKRLPDILEGRSINDHRKVVKAKQAKINGKLKAIPDRISEVQHGLPDISQFDPAALPADLEELRKAKAEKEAELLRIEQGGEIAEKTKQLREMEAELQKLKNAHQQKQYEIEAEAKNKLYAVLQARKNLEQDIGRQEQAIRETETEIQAAESRLESLRKKWKQVDEKKFIHYQDETCPTCGQPIPDEQLEEASEKALAEFNLDKAEKLREINASGQRFSECKNALEAKLQEQLEELKERREALADLKEQEEKLQERSANLPTVEPDPRYEEMAREKEHLELDIEELKAGSTDAVEAARKEAETYDEAIQTLEQCVAQAKQYDQGKARITELKGEKEKLGAEHEKLQRQLDLIDEYTKTEVRMMDEKINSRFKLARFKMFNQLVNGAIEPTCETLFEGVPWNGGLNDGAKVNVGVDIINTLAQHHGFVAPIFCDNAESVTEIIPTEAQLIRLVVSGEDKELRVEVE